MKSVVEGFILFYVRAFREMSSAGELPNSSTLKRWDGCQIQNTSKGLLRKTAAMALNPPLPKQLLQTKQDIMGHFK